MIKNYRPFFRVNRFCGAFTIQANQQMVELLRNFIGDVSDVEPELLALERELTEVLDASKVQQAS